MPEKSQNASTSTERQLADLSDYQIKNPEAFTQNMFRLVEQCGKAMTTVMQGNNNTSLGGSGPMSGGYEVGEAAKTMTELAQHWMSNPTRLAEAQSDLAQEYVDLWQNTTQRFLGQDVEPLAKPEPGDNRFKDPEWSDNPYFDYCKQFYLLSTNWAEAMLAQTEGLSERDRQKAEFHLRQVSSAFSPSNFPMTNPEVFKQTIATNAQNLVDGMKNFLEDMEKSDDLLTISQTDQEAFEVGKNLAVTPGKVIFQNDIFQLIQYEPTTERVRKTPLLIVPPWINKFYILDLTKQKSFVRYVVEQGFTVFLISWVNPDRRHAEKSFVDYMKDGLLRAVDVVIEETGQKKCNALGYCVGGTLLSATLAYLAERNDERIKSATFLTTQIDFEKSGDLSLFVDESQLLQLEEIMAERGYLDGSRMANVFNMLRPRDLIWPYIVNNYMLGKKPFAFDLLYWNQDSTRLPKANHSFYLTEFYNNNALATGNMVLDNVRLEISKVKVPIFELAAREDHIAPAVSVFRGSKLFGGPVEYVLAGSGHIAGVINPPNPDKIKYQYWTNSFKGEDLQAWLKDAKETPGSWWPYWIEWLSKNSGTKVDARLPGQTFEPIEDAPGSYVKMQHDKSN